MGRAPCCSQVGLHRGPWTANEDSLLTRYIEWHGEGDWRNLPEKAGLLRCGKSCRLRWLNYLRPTIKRGNISPDEEDLIIRLHRLLGNRWSLIAGRLPRRTDNEIKNYWNSHLSKKLRKQGIDPVTHKPLESNHHIQKNNGDGHDTHENNKGSSIQDGEVQNGQNEDLGQVPPKIPLNGRESPSTDTLLMQQSVHLPKANRYISFPPGINRNTDDSEGMDNQIKKSMQGTRDDLRHILDEPMGLQTLSNQMDFLYADMSFKSDPWPESNSSDNSVVKMQSPSSIGMELNEPQHEHHLLPLIDYFADDSNQSSHNHLQFCNLEGGSEFMIQNVFQDCSSLVLECNSMNPGKLSLSDINLDSPHLNPSSSGYEYEFEFEDGEWLDCPIEGQVQDILTL